MTTAILCSGQGGQSATMFDVLADAPEAAAVFAAAGTVLDGRNPIELVRQASSAELHRNRLAQVLCCTQALAAWTVLRSRLSGPLIVAGYSVGELAAWGVAGLMEPAEILRLAVRRAAAMDAATAAPAGLAAIRGLTRATLEPLCARRGVFVAIVNAADQMLVGGSIAALDELLADAEAAGATRTTRLPVAVASHTPLLDAAAEQFRRDLAAAHMTGDLRPGLRLLSGLDGAPVFDLDAGADKLARQIRQTVDWSACLQTCGAASVTRAIELGPGRALAQLAQSTLGVDARSIAEFRSLDGVQRWVDRPTS